MNVYVRRGWDVNIRNGENWLWSFMAAWHHNSLLIFKESQLWKPKSLEQSAQLGTLSLRAFWTWSTWGKKQSQRRISFAAEVGSWRPVFTGQPWQRSGHQTTVMCGFWLCSWLCSFSEFQLTFYTWLFRLPGNSVSHPISSCKFSLCLFWPEMISEACN